MNRAVIASRIFPGSYTLSTEEQEFKQWGGLQDNDI